MTEGDSLSLEHISFFRIWGEFNGCFLLFNEFRSQVFTTFSD